MAKFQDAKGREWTIEIPSVGTIAKLRQEYGLDLNMAAQTWGGMKELFEDPERLVAGVFSLLKPAASVPFEEWIESLDREALERLREAFGEAVLDFFHHRRAENLKSDLKRILAPSIPTGSNGSAGSLPASAASPPTA